MINNNTPTLVQKRNYVFETICSMTQPQLKKYLKKRFLHVKGVEKGNGYLYVPGTVPVLLVAHMDTVHTCVPKTFVYGGNNKDEISAPTGIGGDDRCGVYMILKILKKHNCHVLFTEDEEVGCVGTQLFLKTELGNSLKEKFQFIIELDRKGSKDAVFYDCDNPDFTSFITKEYWKKAYGSFTDISYLCPDLGCAGVNFSCGYYNPHTVNEYVNLTEMEKNIEEVCKLLDRTTEADKYEYIESKKSYGYYNSRGYYYDDYYGDYYGGYYSQQTTKTHDGKLRSKYNTLGGFGGYDYDICFFHPDLQSLVISTVKAWSEEEAVGKFLINNPSFCFDDIYSVTDTDDNNIAVTPSSTPNNPSSNLSPTSISAKEDTVNFANDHEEDGDDEAFNEYLASVHGYSAG